MYPAISIHAPREGSDVTRPAGTAAACNHFYPRSPRGERLGAALAAAAELVISIHAPREGSDGYILQRINANVLFLSTLPARGATQFCNTLAFQTVFLSTLPARGATSSMAAMCKTWTFLSTLPARGATFLVIQFRPGHADFYPRSPRGERPRLVWCPKKEIHDFYPRSPRGERRSPSPDAGRANAVFLSTLPARGATASARKRKLGAKFLSTLPARGATPQSVRGAEKYKTFLSTLPARGATSWAAVTVWAWAISIHAPREGSDVAVPRNRAVGMQFLSTLPARGATAWAVSAPDDRAFLSTLPARGATQRDCRQNCPAAISIHAPREGSDRGIPDAITLGWIHFYPRSPRGERLDSHLQISVVECISIHAPREGSDEAPACTWLTCTLFLSTLPARGATADQHGQLCSC